MSGLDTGTLWAIVNYYKIDIFFWGNWHLSKCYQNHPYILYSSEVQEVYLTTLKGLLEKFRNKKINDSDMDSLYNIPKDFLSIAGKFFIYWNLCPKFLYDWTQFYADLMQNASPDIIVLTLNRIIVTAKMRGDKKIFDITKNILIRLLHTELSSSMYQNQSYDKGKFCCLISNRWNHTSFDCIFQRQFMKLQITPFIFVTRMENIHLLPLFHSANFRETCQ